MCFEVATDSHICGFGEVHYSHSGLAPQPQHRYNKRSGIHFLVVHFQKFDLILKKDDRICFFVILREKIKT